MDNLHTDFESQIKPRALVAKTLLEAMRAYGRVNFGSDQLGETIAETLIVAAIVVGQAEGKPMTASDISHYIGLPRPTVIRKLANVAAHRRLGRIKDGARVCYVLEDLEDESIVSGARTIVGNVLRLCRKLSKMNT